MSFRDVSLQLTNSLSKQEKQTQGIFFTPKEARVRIFEILDSHHICPHTILEPSCGSGEFIEDLYTKYKQSTIVGVELNTTLARSIQRPNIYNMDFLTYIGKHDLVIGNPPYFVIEKTDETMKCQTGRPNIFVQFVYKAVRENLTRNGILAFVLPTSFFNCAYYEPTRRYLFENTTLLAVELLPGKYIDTSQNTFVLVLRNGKQNDDYFVSIHNHVYITPFYKELKKLQKGSKTLAELEYSVKTGDVVWNQEKNKLADTGTLLLYSSNFKNGNVTLGNVKAPKKQYIQGFKRQPLTGKTILINRGYGNTTYKLNIVLVDYPSYFAENHVNVIKPLTDGALSIIEKVYASLQNPKTQQFLEYFIGNGALSKSELEHCLPIWID